ncbi:MAG TPA: acetylornithine deacetylase [Chromatiales bacterium]|nr:acetylornithine deacetylase [Chromatiales bacterium]
MALNNLIPNIESLIALPSVSSAHAALDQSNRAVIDLLAGWFAELGFRIEIMDIPGRPGRANLIATLGSGDNALVLAGHTDTVPWDEGQWTQDPFTLKQADDRLYGLGTADMKGFFALIIEAIRDLDAKDLKQPLVILATADEETSMSGAKALVSSGRKLGRHAIIGEPTGLRPVRMHKGIMMQAIHLLGQSGHSSNPALGNNALEGMHKVISNLIEWRDQLGREHRDDAFEVPTPTLNLGYIHGGDNPNRICAHCEMQVDLRPLPGMDLGSLREQMGARVRDAVDGSGLGVELKSLFDGAPAMETPAQAAIVAATERLTGHAAEAVAFGTEGPFLNALGMDTVILGPGDINQAHQPDEYLGLERLNPMVELLRQLIREFCIDSPPENGA